MASGRVGAAVLGVLLVLAYAGGSALWVQTNSGWYQALRRPAWQPPDFVFGLIWPYNFVVLGIALVLIALRLEPREVATTLVVFAASVAASLLWSYLFYVPHHLGGATAALVTAAVLTVPVTLAAFRASTVMGWFLMPYQAWICIAASLCWGYWRLT